MIHSTDGDVWAYYYELPERIQKKADRAYKKLREDPDYASLRFEKKCDTTEGQIWGARVNSQYRALAVRDEPEVYDWFWIGHH